MKFYNQGMAFIIPKHLISEAVYQGEFYMACQKINLRCTLELGTPVGRLDAAVFSDDWKRLIAVVECKRKKSYAKMKSSNQIERYKKLGVPVFGLAGWNWQKALVLAETIQSRHLRGEYAGVDFEKVMRDTPRLNEYGKNKDFDPSTLDPDVNFKPDD